MDYAAARRSMVDNQIRTNRVRDPLIIAAMNELPRERFAPVSLRGIAYADEDIPLGNGRYLIEPLAAALLLQAAEINSDDVVLAIGSASGYVPALIAPMASAVVALEEDPELADRSSALLADLGMNTVAVVQASPRQGYAKQAPYDVIIFCGAVSSVPDAVAAQLAVGGRMVAIVRGKRGMGKVTLFLKTANALSRREVFDAATPYLPGFEPEETFTF